MHFRTHSLKCCDPPNQKTNHRLWHCLWAQFLGWSRMRRRGSDVTGVISSRSLFPTQVLVIVQVTGLPAGEDTVAVFVVHNPPGGGAGEKAVGTGPWRACDHSTVICWPLLNVRSQECPPRNSLPEVTTVKVTQSNSSPSSYSTASYCPAPSML